MRPADIIFNDSISFDEKAEKVFQYQREQNSVYAKFCEALGISKGTIPAIDEMPLLPVRAYKESKLISAEMEPELIFKSSGTTDMSQSKHFVADEALYRESVLRGFDRFYPSDAILLAYTPGYNENPDSSLIWMLNELVKKDSSGMSGFLPLGEPLDTDLIDKISDSGRPLILFGAAFGLLDLINNRNYHLPDDSIVIETGGMKTYRREIDKKELHERLSEGFGLQKKQIHSEYGMCELLSQAYSYESQWFQTVPWMRVTIRDPKDPLRICKPGEEGKIGVIDLANIYSCSFILTEDRGISNEDEQFQVLGRWNPENLRGCNFLIDRD